MHILSIVLQIILGIGFLLFGFMKFGSKQMVDEFKRYRLSSGMRIFTGLVEVLSAAIIIIGIWVSPYALIGAILMAITMFVAALVHLVRVKDPAGKAMMPIFLFILAVIVIVLN
ncbi:DoxX family protein [Paenibacillus sp. CGMCC 1.16610]|uniref:DoxX family protein n=1 Tax=Paenibacillus anseongense TaxID=2682845 RepID=A0ABW9UBC4_9BACL|nr:MULTISPECIES: DoxX family protein [Paenibacillus]MBA2937633.1 DoxX family protein [Paenibacillus sp. CGMCC 1.16610]MVQ36691.1 DoxX family protein [Paenibacillus anseongense]